MARPIKRGLDYFPHDTDAVTDEKIEALRALYENDGYSFYFILLERIYRAPHAEIDISGEETKQILARKVGVTDQKFLDMLTTSLKWGLFDKTAYKEKGLLTSDGIKRRAQVVIDKRVSMRMQYLKSKLGGVSSPVFATETTPETPQSKVKKRKVKKRKADISSSNNSSSLDEDNQVTDLSKNMTGITTLYQAEIGEITPFVARELEDAAQNYSADLVKEAITEAVKQNKRKWNYVLGILKNWGKERPENSPSKNAGSNRINKDDPDKFIKGKYGHMVKR